LIECGDAERDKAAYSLLTNTLAYMEEDLELPEVLDADRQRYMSGGGPELKVSFPAIRLSRSDEAEQFLVAMLQHFEDDVPTDTPVAVALYGRGRALAAFYGELLTAEELEAACVFLVGMCSCQIKALNPGVDLLFSAGWDYFIEGEYVVDEELPDLIGTPDPSAASESTVPVPVPDPGLPSQGPSGTTTLVAALGAVLILAIAVVAVASRTVLRGREPGE
jgi:hypothetical protein